MSFPQQTPLAPDIKRRCVAWRRGREIRRHRGPQCGRRRRTQLQVDERRGSVRGNRESLHAVEHRPDCAHELQQVAQDRRRVPQDVVDALRGGDWTARSAGSAAEKTDEVPLIRW